MKKTTLDLIDNLLTRKPELEYLKNALIDATQMICEARASQNKILVCGNGGSYSDAEHIAGEFNKSFCLKRPIPDELYNKLKSEFPEDADSFKENLEQGIPCIPLPSIVASNTAFNNDKNADFTYAQMTYALGKPNDILICISTSGNSKNVVYPAKLAKTLGIKVISLTGETGGKLKNLSNILLNAPEKETYLVQEHHLSIYHTLCLSVENEIFGK